VAVKKVVVEVNLTEVNWQDYITSIRPVCPWSNSAWAKGQIAVAQWKGQVLSLEHYQARIYTYNTTPRLLKKATQRLNNQYSEFEWLWSHPQYKNYSTPVPVLIQQDRILLNKIRKQLNLI
jgi:hypothetical protein